jgi:hypothetical protein
VEEGGGYESTTEQQEPAVESDASAGDRTGVEQRSLDRGRERRRFAGDPHDAIAGAPEGTMHRGVRPGRVLPRGGQLEDVGLERSRDEHRDAEAEGCEGLPPCPDAGEEGTGLAVLLVVALRVVDLGVLERVRAGDRSGRAARPDGPERPAVQEVPEVDDREHDDEGAEGRPLSEHPHPLGQLLGLRAAGVVLVEPLVAG